MRFFFENWHRVRYIFFFKKAPNFEIVWPTPATPRALTVKGVYVLSHSCYEQLYQPVCKEGLMRSPDPELGPKIQIFGLDRLCCHC